MQPGWMIEAWLEYGQAEISGSDHNGRILALFKDAGHAQVRTDETAWCAAFVGACLKRSGIDGTQSLRARSYLSWGRPTPKGRFGVISVFSRGADPAAGHVGFWVGESPTHVLVLGGNQSNSVNLAWIEKSRLLGVRLPDTTSRMNAAGSFFEIALAHILEVEGGYTDDPVDPGGPTNLGVTLATLAAHRGIEVTAETVISLKAQIKSLTRDTAREIYFTRYWKPAAASEMPRGVALMHFDAAVNQGVGTAARILQEAANVDVDGEIGPLTRAAIWRADQTVLLEAYAEIRRRRYRTLKHYWKFGRGWLNRVEKTLESAKSFAGEHVPQNGALKSKGRNDMPTTEPTIEMTGEKWWGESLTIWGSIITGLSTVLPVVGPLVGLNITSELVVLLGEHVVQVGQAVGGLLGTLMVIQGRMRAQTRLTSRPLTLRV